MPKRPDRSHCCNGHDLRRTEAVYVRSSDGYKECRECKRLGVRRVRAKKRRAVGLEPSTSPPRQRPIPELSNSELERRLQQIVADETLPAYMRRPADRGPLRQR